jgi:predicted transcriptional regulator
MTLTIEISPEMEKRLQREAGRKGVAAEEYARRLLEERLLPTESKPLWATATQEEWEAAFDRWLTSHDPTLPPLPEEAMRRESFYGERG